MNGPAAVGPLLHGIVSPSGVPVMLLGLGTSGTRRQAAYVDGERLDFSLPDLQRRAVSSSDPRFRGKLLLIDLRGSRCPPCLTEIPTFIDLQKRLDRRFRAVSSRRAQRRRVSDGDPDRPGRTG